jgi:two-component system response regulator AtoC
VPPDVRDPSRAAFELVVFSGEEIRTFALPRSGEVTIGRDEGSTVRIDDPSVSRQHAVLRVGDGLEIEDLGGANGTFMRPKAHGGAGNSTVNVRQLLGKKAELTVGDCLLFGTASVVVRHERRVELPDLGVPEVPDTAGAGVVLRDPAMRALYTEAARAARSNISILLLGETGVGKEVLARAIHAHSPRSNGPFIAVNCAAIAESLLESELFGSEKGAFTGSSSARAGLFEAAQGGTVFLDEIGELPLAIQAKLLRVLEERAVTRLGSTRPRPVDVRFVAATNRDPEIDSKNGRFRQDLYYRLNGISFVIPPLRDRPQEIDVLAGRFLTAACRGIERAEPLALSPAVLDLLRRHTWPGNVRELRNVVERAVVLCVGAVVLPEHLPPSLLAAIRAGGTQPPPSRARQGESGDLQTEMKSIERARIVEALERCHGNQSEAARQLGMPRRTLVTRLTEFGLSRPRKHTNEL